MAYIDGNAQNNRRNEQWAAEQRARGFERERQAHQRREADRQMYNYRQSSGSRGGGSVYPPGHVDPHGSGRPGAVSYGMAAYGNLIMAPTASGMLAKELVHYGIRDPRQAMFKATGLVRSNQLYAGLMVVTGTIALFLCYVGSDDLRMHFQTAGGAGVLALGLAWLWMLRVIHGAILHYWTKDTPIKMYDYVWFWPRTSRTDLKATKLPQVMADKTLTSKERFVMVVGIVQWVATIKLPLYITMAFVVNNLYQALQPH